MTTIRLVWVVVNKKRGKDSVLKCDEVYFRFGKSPWWRWMLQVTWSTSGPAPPAQPRPCAPHSRHFGLKHAPAACCRGGCRALARLLLLLLDLLPGWCVLLALSGSPPVMASLRVNMASSHLLFYLELTNESTIQNISYFANKLTYSTSTFLLDKYFVKKRERNRPFIRRP